MDLDRRVDPRTDLDYSLKNLLRTRVARHAYLVAVLTTHDGLVLAASRGPGADDRLAERAAAHASTSTPLDDGRARLLNRRFEVDGQPLMLAIVGPDAPQDEPALTDMARRVEAILGERRARAAA